MMRRKQWVVEETKNHASILARLPKGWSSMKSSRSSSSCSVFGESTLSVYKLNTSKKKEGMGQRWNIIFFFSVETTSASKDVDLRCVGYLGVLLATRFPQHGDLALYVLEFQLETDLFCLLRLQH